MLDTLLEIERLIYRPNISEKAQYVVLLSFKSFSFKSNFLIRYYGFCCMNQFTLTRHDQDIANRLLIIYFSFFKVLFLISTPLYFRVEIYQTIFLEIYKMQGN